jgi:hypothetical protein
MESISDLHTNLLDNHSKGLIYEIDNYRVIIISDSTSKNFDILKNGIGELPAKCKTTSFGK